VSDFLNFVAEHLPLLLSGLGATVTLTVVAIWLGFGLGLSLALVRTYAIAPLRALARTYIALVRGTPLITQLFVVYHGLPQLGITFTPFTAAIVGLTLNSAAYQAEYFRGAILAVRRGQLMAARALGMTKLQTIRHVVLPQIIRLVIPSWANELVYLIKYSSLASLIQVRELTFQARHIASETYRTMEIFLVAAAIYLSLVLVVSYVLRRVELWVRIPGLGAPGR
jgi:polar amino acid transport system permease protein